MTTTRKDLIISSASSMISRLIVQIPACLAYFYCVDDRLAQHFNYAPLGSIPVGLVGTLFVLAVMLTND